MKRKSGVRCQVSGVRYARGVLSSGLCALFLLSVVCSPWSVVCCHAAEPTGTETWDTGTTAGWVGFDPLNGAEFSLVNPGDYLKMEFRKQSTPFPQVHIVRAVTNSSAGNFTGDYWNSAIVNVSFKFLASTHKPGDLKLYLYSAASRRWWYFPLTSPAIGTWGLYTVPLEYGAGWRLGVGGNESQFVDDLKHVTWIGLQIQRNSATVAHTFGLDDFVIYGASRAADSDGDGASDWQEFQAGTDPNDGDSAFLVSISQTNAVKSAAGIVLHWPSAVNRTYTVERSSDLPRGFTNLQTSIPATPPVNTFVDQTATGTQPYFYRIKLED